MGADRGDIKRANQPVHRGRYQVQLAASHLLNVMFFADERGRRLQERRGGGARGEQIRKLIE